MTIEHAIDWVLSRTDDDVTEADILSPQRGNQAVCEARHNVMSMLHRDGWTPARIGLYMHRHHTTVLHALGLRDRAAKAEKENKTCANNA